MTHQELRQGVANVASREIGCTDPTRSYRTMKIAALFVEPNGHYATDQRVDCWDKLRNATNYSGNAPVVAHPPCQLWTNFAALNYSRYGGEHNRPGNDGGLFAFALDTIRRCGGVIEHPAGSNAWKAYSLKRPDGIGWTYSGNGEWSCEVWQSAYGHRARKRTWLYYVGSNRPSELDWSRKPGTHQVGWFDRKKPTLSKREAILTPKPFADTLILLAQNCGGKP